MLKTIIIGAGFAGLSAARTLMKENRQDFVVLEARNRVGGRTKPGRIGDLDIDLGGMWMGPSQTRLKHLADHYGVRPYPTYLDGNAVFRIGKRQRLGAREDPRQLFGIAGGVAYLFAKWRLERSMAALDITQPWAHPKAEYLDAMTLATWIRHNVHHSLARAAFRTICNSLLCAEPSQVSLLFFLHYLKSGGGLDVLISADDGGAQNFVFHGGAHQISRFMATDIGDRLHTDAPVTKVEWQEDRVTVHSATGTFTARTLITAISPTLMHRINFSPTLPQAKVAVHERLFMGSSIKFWVLYDRPFWRDEGLNGTILRDDVDTTPVMDVSPPGQEKGLLVGFFDANRAIGTADLSKTQRREIVIDMLAEHFGPKAQYPLDYVDHDWMDEEWSGGCYGAYAPPGVTANLGKALRAPIGPLHWAGTETSPEWTGYIEGAIRSGERAAREVL